MGTLYEHTLAIWAAIEAAQEDGFAFSFEEYFTPDGERRVSLELGTADGTGCFTIAEGNI